MDEDVDSKNMSKSVRDGAVFNAGISSNEAVDDRAGRQATTVRRSRS